MEEYNQVRFMAPKCHTHYYGDLPRTKLLPKKGIFLEKIPKKLSAFHDRFMATGWQCFALNPCKANEQWIHEFYANLSLVSFSDPSNIIIRIWGKEVTLGWRK